MNNNCCVYTGLPFEREGTFVPSSPAKTHHSIAEEAPGTSTGYGLLAFLVGALLAVIAWVANRGWAILSVFAFGDFTWALASAWKHVLLCLFGSMTSTIAVWTVFVTLFPECDSIDGDDVEFENDVSDALRDLGQLGFVVGYFASQTLCVAVLYKPLVNLGIEYNHVSDNINTATLVVTMMWVLSTKMRDYMRAARRRNIIEHVRKIQPSDPYSYVHIV